MQKWGDGDWGWGWDWGPGDGGVKGGGGEIKMGNEKKCRRMWVH